MYVNQTNMKIRCKLFEVNKTLSWLATQMKVSESTVTRMMRQELPEEEQNRIVALIEAAKD